MLRCRGGCVGLCVRVGRERNTEPFLLVEKSLAARASRHVVILRFLFDLTVFFLVLLPMAARVSALGLSALARAGPTRRCCATEISFLLEQ